MRKLIVSNIMSARRRHAGNVLLRYEVPSQAN